ncbi:MAG: tetratricopeptide repeat protein [Pyrinomonadaceae bacterium]
MSQSATEDAVEHLKQAITIYPQYQIALHELGMQYRKLKQLDDAVAQFEAALKVNADAFQPRLNLGIVLVEQKKFADAREHLNRALKIESGNPAAHLYMGIATLGSDELPIAFEELSQKH